MKIKLHFSISIQSTVAVVYDKMLGLTDLSNYESWTALFNPTSTYEGTWEKGSKILFIGVDENGAKGGMVSIIAENKPQEFVSDLAIIGIYYFQSGETLESELQYLIDNDIKEKGEYQLTNAMENMKNKGMLFVPGAVDEWLDCGNYTATVYTNQRVLVNKSTQFEGVAKRFGNDVVIHEPCFIGDDVQLKKCEIGPFVSIGNNSKLENCVIRNSIIQESCDIKEFECENSMIGNHVCLNGKTKEYSLGDYSVLA
jgi:glucose-1-phosphate thymidylyltransferase